MQQRSSTPVKLALWLTAVMLLVSSGALSSEGAQDPGPQDETSRRIEVLDAQVRANELLLSRVGVVGTGIGQDDLGNPILYVLVEAPSDIISVPGHIDGVQTRVLVTGRLRSLDCPLGPSSDCDPPIPAGVSVGHPAVSAGTLGAYLQNSSGEYLALSNNHIFADENQASIGDTVLQPGPVDGGTLLNPSHVLGTLDDFEPLVFCTAAPCAENALDAAIVSVGIDKVDPDTYCGWRPTSSPLPLSQVVPNSTLVKKCGRTTGYTSALVTMTNVTAQIELDDGNVLFSGLVAAQSMAEPGDSGALMVDSGNRPVALIFAGNGSVTVGAPIQTVLDRFDASVVSIDPGDVDRIGDEIFFYRADGNFRYYPMSAKATLGGALASGAGYSKGWNSITGVDLDGDGTDEMLFYRNDGTFKYYRTKSTGGLGALLLSGTGYSKSWDIITAVDLDGDGQDEMFFYRADGTYKYYEIGPTGALGALIRGGTGYTPNWATITAVDLDGDGQDEMFFYKSYGKFKYYDLTSSAGLSLIRVGSNYSKDWDIITAIDVDGNGDDEMFFYRETGSFKYYQVGPTGALGAIINSGTSYSRGWDAITSVQLD